MFRRGARAACAPGFRCGSSAIAPSRRACFSTIDAVRAVSDASGGIFTVTVESGGKEHCATVPVHGSSCKPSEAEQAGAMICSVLEGLPVAEQQQVDRELEEMPGSQLAEVDRGAAAALVTAASMAVCRAGAAAAGVPLYHHIATLAGKPTADFVMPIPFIAALSGGKRAGNHLPAQDVLVCANAALTYAHALELGAEVLSVLRGNLTEIWGAVPMTTAIGSLVPPEEDTQEAVQTIYEAIEDAGLGDQVTIGLHVAPAHGLFTGNVESVDLYDLNYKSLGENADEQRGESLCYSYQKLSERYPLVSYFGMFDGNDLENHSRLTNLIDIQHIGTDLIIPSVTTKEEGSCSELPINSEAVLGRLTRAAESVACHGLLLSLGGNPGGAAGVCAVVAADSDGVDGTVRAAAADAAATTTTTTTTTTGGITTVSAAVAVAAAAEDLVMVTVVDTIEATNESFNAHLAVGLRCGQCLAAAPSAPYRSTLLAIEEDLGARAVFAAQLQAAEQ